MWDGSIEAFAIPCSPAVNGSVQLSIDREIRPLVREPRGERFIDLYPQTGRIARLESAVGESITMREHPIGIVGMAHVLLDSEVVNADIEVEGGGHAHRAQVGGAVRARAHGATDLS